MRLKIILSVLIFVCGLSLFGLSGYITKQVAIGRGEIAQWQAQVNTTNRIINDQSSVKHFGNLLTAPVQEKLDAGTVKANYYTSLSNRLKIGGIVLILLSTFFVFLIVKNRKKHWTKMNLAVKSWDDNSQ